MTTAGVRTLLLWCPDWPVVAAEIVDGVPSTGPVAVLSANRVLACSSAARADGVRRGLRRREAQSRSPQLTIVDHDPSRDARAFEPVVAAVEQVAVGVEMIRPGACALAARGPTRYFGGEEAAAEQIVEQVAQACEVEAQIGIADGVFAAGLAARAGRIIAPGHTPGFLADLPVEALDRPDLVDLLSRLGLRTLGAFAALPASDVLTRFGFAGALAHRLAAGFDHRPLAVRRPPPDLDVTDTFDDPLERVDVAAFAGRALAERLHERLAAHGLACTRLGIEAVTADGQELHRVWRHDGTLTTAAIAERVRWQLDGWLSGTHRRGVAPRPTAGLVRLRLIPDGVLVHLGLQPGLWGDTGTERERAHRALSRVQGLLGPESVVTAVLGGGRSPADRVRLVPWGDERIPARPGADLPAEPVPASPPVEAPVLVAVPDPDPVSSPDVSVVPRRISTVIAFPGTTMPSAVVRRDPGPHRGPGPEPVAASAAVPDPGLEKAGAEKWTWKAGKKAKGAVARRSRPPVAPPPWPGRLPRPAPALVLPQPLTAVILDGVGAFVGVSARLEMSGVPASLIMGISAMTGASAAAAGVVGWAGPWPGDERWWAGDDARRCVRLQIGLADGRALLLVLNAGQWSVEAIYD
jgi:protein ImuB